jgi:hypothetical protein
MVFRRFDRSVEDVVGSHNVEATPLHDEVYTGPPRPERAGIGERDTGAAAGRSQWTVAINLAANATFGGDQNGALNQWQRLQELKEQSRGSSVNLIVQIAEGESSEKGGDRPGAKTTVTRYLISNGEMRQLSRGQSRGMAGDVEDLLRTANSVAPAEHVGLIQQSHAKDVDGVMGSAGRASLTEFTDAIRAGLQGSGHERLDLIDFNACSMGSIGVMQRMSGIADHMVASAEAEFSDRRGAYDAQNIRSELARLMQHPQWTGSQLASDTISQAHAGANDGLNSVTNQPDTGTPTLAHYDLTRVRDFNAALDALGSALARSVRGNRDNLAAVNHSIESAPLLPKGGVSIVGCPPELRDLSTFARHLIGEIDAGRFTDADNRVRRAAEGLLATQHLAEPQYHGTPNGGYDRLGGMNAFLPDLEIRDPSRDAGQENPMSGLIQQVDEHNEYARNIQKRTSTQRNIASSLDQLRDLFGDAHANELRTLREGLTAVQNATDAESYVTALRALSQRVIELSHGSFGTDANTYAHRRTRDEYFNRQALANVPGWQQFMEMLRTSEER